MDGGAWQGIVHSIAESDMTERLHFQHMAEKKKKHSRELYSVLFTDLSRKEILKEIYVYM